MRTIDLGYLQTNESRLKIKSGLRNRNPLSQNASVHRVGKPLACKRDSLVYRGVLGQWADGLSFPYIDAAWITDCPSAASKLVLISLADHADKKGRCFPSVNRIAKRCSLSRRGVQKQLRILTALGCLSIESKAGMSSNYKLNLRTVCAPPANGVHPTCAPCSPKPSVTVIEPKGVRPSVSQKISDERQLERIVDELKGFASLSDYSKGSTKYSRLLELRAGRDSLRKKLGVIA